MGGKGYRHTQTQTDTQRHTKCSLRGLTRETLFFPACLRVGQTLAAHSRGQLRVRREAVRTQLSETSKAPQQDLPVTTNMLSETGTSLIGVLGATHVAAKRILRSPLVERAARRQAVTRGCTNFAGHAQERSSRRANSASDSHINRSRGPLWQSLEWRWGYKEGLP